MSVSALKTAKKTQFFRALRAQRNLIFKNLPEFSWAEFIIYKNLRILVWGEFNISKNRELKIVLFLDHF